MCWHPELSKPLLKQQPLVLGSLLWLPEDVSWGKAALQRQNGHKWELWRSLKNSQDSGPKLEEFPWQTHPELSPAELPVLFVHYHFPSQGTTIPVSITAVGSSLATWGAGEKQAVIELNAGFLHLKQNYMDLDHLFTWGRLIFTRLLWETRGHLGFLLKEKTEAKKQLILTAAAVQCLQGELWARHGIALEGPD